MYQQLRKSVAALAPLTERELRFLEQQFVYREVPKKFALVEEGQIAREVYFINRGCLRFYYNRDGDEITGFIFTENLFATALDSFLQQEPSSQIVETLEDCELLVISYSNMQRLYDYSTNFQLFGRRIGGAAFSERSAYTIVVYSGLARRTLSENPDYAARMATACTTTLPGFVLGNYSGITQSYPKTYPLDLLTKDNVIHQGVAVLL